MARKKQLKVNGSLIDAFSVGLVKVKHSFLDEMVDRISVKIEAEGQLYEYEISSDTRHPDFHRIQEHICSSIEAAKAGYLNVEVSEYTERNYLFFNVQKIGQEQYTGIRI
ncbi:hypothetical protein [Vibrio parahaemolyticus]|uniref:hypothetical protein n=1 Tax=Vibrio parahaemolyticus TaxID=670 RepID=UPI00236162F6|nr:hypothetical protein [Vibrio parahaemolyticus]MDL2014180.1 hypothetical protein [Vibrio parahaemolyticus]HCH3852793.1 hypothetical protein [Vibrio parahaemolyticus]HCM1418210.1 hypothetical protein [Vibrio parahaemolyticus]